MPDGTLTAEQNEPTTQGSDGVSFVASTTDSCGLNLELSFYFDRLNDKAIDRTRFRYQDVLSVSADHQVSGQGTVVIASQVVNTEGAEVLVHECSEPLSSSGTFEQASSN